jgi:hypothetical protein
MGWSAYPLAKVSDKAKIRVEAALVSQVEEEERVTDVGFARALSSFDGVFQSIG